MTSFVEVKLEDFSLAASRGPSQIVVTLDGTADLAAADALDAALVKVHDAAVAAALAEVVVDLRGVEFMNSSCLKAILTWVNDVQELDESRRYAVRFISDPRVHWQNRSLHSVKCFASDIISISHV
jgi:anti-anti-sigma factor